MKSLICLLLFIGQFSFAADAERAEWFKCQNDDDCVDISYPCSGATVNKKFLEEANKLYRYQNSIKECAIPVDKNPLPFKVFCKDGKCGKQGKNPKMGFS